MIQMSVRQVPQIPSSHLARRLTAGAVLSLSVLSCVLTACGSAPKEVESQWNAERLYAEAKEETSLGNYERAGKLYERLEGRASGTALAQQAQIERAYILYKNADKAQALSTLERFIKLHPTSAALDYALYLQGLINFNDNLGVLGNLSRQDLSERDQQASRDSYQSFKQLVEQFPQSLYVDDARVRMNYIVNSLAAYELHVARYYYRRGAYVAALGRAQTVVTDYQESPSVREALSVMSQSYAKLGLTTLREGTDRVLAKNFAAGAVAVPGPGSAKKAWWQFW
jgi:outer membrane protein assembly factor BamD